MKSSAYGDLGSKPKYSDKDTTEVSIVIVGKGSENLVCKLKDIIVKGKKSIKSTIFTYSKYIVMTHVE